MCVCVFMCVYEFVCVMSRPELRVKVTVHVWRLGVVVRENTVSPCFLMCLGLARTVYIHTVYDRMYGVFPAKNTVRTPYIPINVWLWPTLIVLSVEHLHTVIQGDCKVCLHVNCVCRAR